MSETTTTRTRTATTLDDVAREAGVSLATASRVLNGSERKVADSYRARVEAAAEHLGYTANLSAQATAKGTSAILALLVADIADPYFGQIAAGVARGAAEAGLVVTMSLTNSDREREAQLVHALRGQRPRGLILAASRVDSPDTAGLSAELDAVTSTGGQVVMLGNGTNGIRSVSVDNRGGARKLGAELARLGYRDSIAIAAAEGVRTSDERLAGFTEGFTSGGGAVTRVLRRSFARNAGYDLATLALAEGIASGTLIFAACDALAFGVMSAIHDAGREIGTDIAVAGFDDIETCRDVRPGLTTASVPLEELGYRAAKAATTKEWDADLQPLPVEVVVRGSTPHR